MANRKVKMEARMLVDGEVSSVSLVNRGANRLPFRIQKTENPMSTRFGLDTLSLKKSEPKLTLAGMMVPRAKADDAVKALKEDGFDVVGQEDAGENATFLKFAEGATTEGAAIAGTGANTAAVVHNMKSFTSFPHTKDFDENLKASAFFPSIWDASEALEDTLHSVLYDVDAKEPPLDEVQDALDKFSNHVMGLVQNLPATVFKMDSLYKTMTEDTGTAEGEASNSESAAKTEAAKADADAGVEGDKASAKGKTEKAESEETGAAENDAADNSAGSEEPGDNAADNADNGTTDDEGGENADPSDDAEGDKSTQSKSEEGKEAAKDQKTSKAESDPVLQALQGMKETMEERFKSIEDSLSETRSVANAAKETAHKADKALKGTVSNNEAGDRETRAKNQEGNRTFEDGFYGNGSGLKSEDDGQPPIRIESH